MESEKKVEAYLVRRVKDLGGRAYKWTSPGNAGVPDRICVFPGGAIGFVELKGKGGRVSPSQELQLGRLRRLGCRACVVWSREEVDLFIEEVMRA